MVFDHLSKSDPEQTTLKGADGKPLTGAQLLIAWEYLAGAQAREEIESLRGHSKPWRHDRHLEFFLDGADYQIREPRPGNDLEQRIRRWKFPAAPLTAATLPAEYGEMLVFSRDATAATPGLGWNGRDRDAQRTQGHYPHSLDPPPVTAAVVLDWDRPHPFDQFFSGRPGDCRVVRQETVDGRLLTVVDVATPMGADPVNRLVHRGWLDLARGALPMRTIVLQGSAKSLEGQACFEDWRDGTVTRTLAATTLPNGAHYPQTTVSEFWHRDLADPSITPAWRSEIASGSRRPPKAVFRRRTWDCTLVEAGPKPAATFFQLPIPAGTRVEDLDRLRVQ